MKNWIPIRHDYLKENFDSLLESLADADFENLEDGLLQESIVKLEEVARDLLTTYFPHRLGITIPIDDEYIKNLRITLASIYATLKRGKPMADELVTLLDSLVVNNVYRDQGSFEKIKSITVNLALGNGIETLPYSLKDLAADSFNLPLFAQKLLGITFLKNGHIMAGYEGKGSCLFQGDKVKISTERLSRLISSKLKTFLYLSLGVSILDDEKKKPIELDFKDQVVLLNRLIQTAREQAPEVRKKLKTYTQDQTFYVKVTDVIHNFEWVKCETIDPSYERLELYLDLLNFHNLSALTTLTRRDFLQALSKGNILKVRLIEKDGRQYFSLYGPLREFFTNPENFPDTYEAIFITGYPGGSRWLTHLGHTVNIMNNKWDNEIAEAEAENCNLSIEVGSIKQNIDKNGNTVLNATRKGEIYEISHEEFRKEIPGNLIADLLDFWKEECPVFTAAKPLTPMVGEIFPRIICHLLATMSQDSLLPFYERYYNFTGSRIMAAMTDDTHDGAYCEFMLNYLKALWAFAQDPGHSWLGLPEIPDELKETEAAAECSAIIRTILGYNHNPTPALPSADNQVDIERLRNLIDAANALAGNIAETEINRIKRSISQCLGIKSIYKEEASDKHWFGEESDMLEFKTSIVFLPSKTGDTTPNPDIQIWQILKTVNGFLNSLHGGTLQLGVNDFGNAAGVDEDIRWLYRNNHILTPEADPYLRYIKHRVDNAFEAYRRSDKDSDITATRVRYSLSQVEGRTVLRIDILPFELGCVRMKDTLRLHNRHEVRRPADIKEAYIRAANTTEELTQTKREKMEEEKRKVIKDSEQQKFIAVQEAIDSCRYVRLDQYQSYKEVADRVVEPVELLPQRGLLVGIKKGDKNLRVFKLSRCEEVSVLDETFKRSKYSYSVDPFNMLATGKNVTDIRVRLDRLGWLLIQETYPYTANFLSKDNTDPEFPFLLSCPISDVRGIGSFCLSILDHFKIINNPALESYIKERIKNYR
ncbi:MAG: WYL domain-containing protein [Muribaculaceae bacterium]|nr:WYL domain-containing protein [Muribaculaceae bacterium]